VKRLLAYLASPTPTNPEQRNNHEGPGLLEKLAGNRSAKRGVVFSNWHCGMVRGARDRVSLPYVSNSQPWSRARKPSLRSSRFFYIYMGTSEKFSGAFTSLNSKAPRFIVPLGPGSKMNVPFFRPIPS